MGLAKMGLSGNPGGLKYLTTLFELSDDIPVSSFVWSRRSLRMQLRHVMRTSLDRIPIKLAGDGSISGEVKAFHI